MHSTEVTQSFYAEQWQSNSEAEKEPVSRRVLVLDTYMYTDVPTLQIHMSSLQ